MVAKSGDSLLAAKAVEDLKSHLLPLADLVTPNLPEASVLLGREVSRRDQMADACRDLARLGCRAVYLKGGHLAEGSSLDLLFDAKTGKIIELEGERILTPNSHGTGCTLSSAIAAHLARGLPMTEAVREAKEYLGRALQAGADLTLGRGHGPVHHFHGWWRP
jgi:hydroxymethylpyrimidine/phosphomethylpyrimidine kinase